MDICLCDERYLQWYRHDESKTIHIRLALDKREKERVLKGIELRVRRYCI